jgi:hypothetical protein
MTHLRHQVIDNVIGDAPVPSQAARELDDEALYLVCERAKLLHQCRA